MTSKKPAPLAAVLLAGTLLVAAAFAGSAQAQSQPYGYYPYPADPSYYRAPAAPPAWSYDPYTSGMTACPQRDHRDPPCSETLFPTYGQPNYRR